ncbi:MAG: hypothetical protein IPL61_16100 [Myxococcales bacterium]|nr:hypothetical protein [Myxococcales bacterium]
MPVAPARRDPRRFIYVGIDVALTILYLVLLADTLHNRHASARLVLYILPMATTMMAVGTAFGRAWGWWLTIAGGATLLVWTVGLVIVLLTTASYLSGVYGAFGKAAASGALLAVFLVIEAVAFLPTLQLKWALTRAGRRAYGLPVKARA